MWWALLACNAPVELDSPRPGGVALGLFASDAHYDYGGLVQEIAETGAGEILLAVPWSLPDGRAHGLRSAAPRSALVSALNEARVHRLAATVMPLVTLERGEHASWRGEIAPDDRDLFWANYRALLRSVAIDAERGGATRLVIGSELNALESDPAWPTLATEAREHFSGQVTYSANWDRFAEVPFWHALDEIAVTAYFPVRGPETWPAELSSLHAFAAIHDRPLVISEYGYPALASAAERPWDEATGAPYAPELQTRLLTEALDALRDDPPAAHFLWNWFGTGAADEASFTPRNRPAAVAVSRAFHPRDSL